MCYSPSLKDDKSKWLTPWSVYALHKSPEHTQMLWVILIIINSKLFLIVANPINWMLPFTIFNIFLFLFLRRFYRVTEIIFIASIEITFQRWQSIIWSIVFTWKWENINENTSKPPPLFSYPCEYILQKMMNGWTVTNDKAKIWLEHEWWILPGVLKGASEFAGSFASHSFCTTIISAPSLQAAYASRSSLLSQTPPV